MSAPSVQWWLAELDRYGNPTLIDGMHSDRAGVELALTLYEKLASSDNFLGHKVVDRPEHGFAIARVELFEPAPVRAESEKPDLHEGGEF